MKTAKTQQGFTLIELIVVIIILGILGATALPRFMDTRVQAEQAAVAGVAGAVGAAVQMVRAQYLVTANATGDDIVGFGDGTVDVCMPPACAANPGYPVGTGGANDLALSDARCLEVWNGIMQNPPRAQAAAANVSTAGFDWNATAVGATCQYSYRRAVAALTAPTRFFTYNPINGAIAITNP